MLRYGDLTPEAFIVLQLLRWHEERRESVSEGLLAQEARMSKQRIGECLRELVKWPEKSLIV